MPVDLKRLTPETRLALQRILEIKRAGKSIDGILSDLYAEDYERVPVPFIQFVEDDYYLGTGVKDLSQAWKDCLSDVFRPGSEVNTLVMTGSIGCGKTTAACVALAYKLYELSCLKDPAGFFGLLPKSKVVFGSFNVTLEKASDIEEKLEVWIKQSPYFAEHCPVRERPRFPLTFPSKNIEISPGSLGSHALGDNMFSFVLDEANFYKKIKDDPIIQDRAQQIVHEARTRLASRFKRCGKTPGLILLISSRKFQTSFLDNLIEKTLTDEELARSVKVVSFALWQTKRASDFSGESFRVLVGTERYSSRIVEDDEILPEDAELVRVPQEYHSEFAMDPDLALRDIAGISTAGSKAFFPVMERIRDCVDHNRTHPLTKLELNTIGTNSQWRVEDFIDNRKLCKIEANNWTPLVDPAAGRYVHVDLAITGECLGLVMGHPITVDNGRLGVYIDLMVRIRPPATGEIDLSSPITFLKYLKNTLYFKIEEVTFDQFQSRLLLQLLIRDGFKARLLSIGLEHYNHLKTVFNEGRMNFYEYGPVLEELRELQRDPAGGRPGHPPNGLDDVSDALAGVVSQCYQVESKSKKNIQAVRVQGRELGPLVIGLGSDGATDRFIC